MYIMFFLSDDLKTEKWITGFCCDIAPSLGSSVGDREQQSDNRMIESHKA